MSAIMVTREGESLLFDCGEGTQRQMMRFGASFSFADVFFTHFHGDHLLGITGLVRTLGLQGRSDAMRLHGPRGAGKVLRDALGVGAERQPFAVDVVEVEPGTVLDRGDYRIDAFPVEHGSLALGYALVEKDRLGRFDPDAARAAGVPEGPLWGQLQRGRAVTLPEGRVVPPEGIVGAPRPGRKLVYTGDTRPCEATVTAAAGADLLIHEATFGEEERDRARETGHSTAKEAAEVAVRAAARRLALTHVSARYSRDAVDLKAEARAVFPGAIVAKDGQVVDVPFPE